MEKVYEVCPYCDTEVQIDNEPSDCPICGNEILPCLVCQEELPGGCDWDSITESCSVFPI